MARQKMVVNGRFVEIILLLLISFLSCSFASATKVRGRVMDPAGYEGVAGAFVTTRSLTGVGTVLRNISGSNGYLPPLDLKPGLYETVITYPYGYYFTQARDYEVGDAPVSIEVHLDGSIGGAIFAVTELHVRVLDVENRPVAGAWVVARNAEADRDSVSVNKTDENGAADIKIPLDGAEVTAIYHGISSTEKVNIPSGIRICSSECYDREVERVQKEHKSISIQLKR